MSHVVTRRLEIDAGHRLLGHETKCRNVHGHRYAFEVTVAGGLDDVGRVVDFGVIKERVGAWLDRWWDHAYIAEEADPIVTLARSLGLRVFPVGFPPTAENLAKHLFDLLPVLLDDTGVTPVRVRCYETPGCWADYPPPEEHPIQRALEAGHCGRCAARREP